MKYVYLLPLMALMGVVNMPFNASAQETKAEEPLSKEEVLTVRDSDRVLGDADAPITLFEFASLSCSHCADFHLKVLPEIKKEYVDTGKVRVVMRDFPLNEPALRASQLTHCTDESKTYQRLTNAVFRTQSTWLGEKNYLEILGNIGKLAGISGEAYDACLKDEELETQLLTDKLNAMQTLGVRSTPSFILNGELYAGGRGFEFFKEKFDALLEE